MSGGRPDSLIVHPSQSMRKKEREIFQESQKDAENDESEGTAIDSGNCAST